MESGTTALTDPTSPPVTPDADALMRFLDELKASGYRIGSDQYVLALDLLAALVARGPFPALGDFARLLGPLLCKSAAQQAEFRGKLERWLETTGRPAALHAPTVVPSSDPHRLAGFLGRIERRNRIGMWVTIVIALAVIGAAVWFFRPRTPLPVPIAPPPVTSSRPPNLPGGVALPPNPTPEAQKQAASSVAGVLSACMGLLVSFGVAWTLIWRRRARIFLARRPDISPPDITRVNVQSLMDALLPPAVIATLARAMRRRFELPSTDIVVEPTLEETLNHGGWFTPVYGRIRIPPEYLVLVNRGASGDPNGVFARDLISRLQRSAVLMNCFYFDNDPRILIPFKPMRGRAGEQARPILLREAETLYGNLRLLVVADGGAITALSPAEVETWTSRFRGWSDRSLLSTAPLDAFSPGHQLLASQFAIFDTYQDGLIKLTRKLDTGLPALNSPVVSQLPVPEILLTRPAQWLDPLEPEPRRIDNLLLALRAYLGPGGFRWLGACAAYPEINANLTLYLGQALHTADGSPLFNPLTLACLSRLVWFRQSFMPDWLRIALLNSMPPDAQQEVRNALEGLLIGALSGDISSAELRIAKKHREVVSRLMRAILKRLAVTGEAGAPLQDRVFLSFFAGNAAVTRARALRNLLTSGSTRGRLQSTPDFRRGQIVMPRILMLIAALIATGVALLSVELSIYSFVLVPFAACLGLVLLRAVWRTRNPWVLGAMLLLSYCFVAGWVALLLQAASPWFLWLGVCAELAFAVVIFTSAWSGMPYRREPVPVSPIRRLWGYAGLAGVGAIAVVSPLLLPAPGTRAFALFAFALPAPVGSLLTFSALNTTAKWTLRCGFLCLFMYIDLVLFFIGSMRGVIVGSAVFDACLLFCFVRSLMEWRKISFPSSALTTDADE